MTNLLVSMLDKVGVPMDTLGDSTGAPWRRNDARATTARIEVALP